MAGRTSKPISTVPITSYAAQNNYPNLFFWAAKKFPNEALQHACRFANLELFRELNE
jgi:hypothetical protein